MADDGIQRTTVRYSCVKKEHHRKAYEIVKSKSNATKNEFIIQAILEKEESSNLADIVKLAVREELSAKNLNINITGMDELLRNIVREELARVPLSHTENSSAIHKGQQEAESTEITVDAMNFLSTL